MISKELIEKAKKCASKEELIELAKSENIEFNDTGISNILAELASADVNKELSDEELENVAGGTCYSGSTYAELGIEPISLHGQQCSWYHPVITTSGNICPLHPRYHEFWIDCGICDYHYTISPTIYCKVRSSEFDPGINH